MSSFRIDLLDPATGLKTGRASITTATQVTRSQALDRVGKWAFDVAITDPALPDIEGKDFAVYWFDGAETVYLGQGSYLDHQLDATGRSVQVQAASRLRDLTRQTVTQRSFDGATATVNTVLSEIVPLRAGWSLGAVDTIASAAPMDFWYETIFDSVALLAKTFGYHFREGEVDRTLDFGAMGTDSGVLALGGDGLPLLAEWLSNPRLALIGELRISYQSSTVVNRLIPFGGAVGVATIDLSETTVTQPGYPVQSAVLPGGGNYTYLEDAASQAAYGLTERRFLRKDLRPISNAPDARRYAANILYEATLASLLNLKNRQTVYEVSLARWTPNRVRVGDKIRLLYRGVAETAAGAAAYLDLDSDPPGQGKAVYVLEITETFGDGVSASLKVNENAVHEETVTDLLASTIQAFETAQIHVQPTISRYTVGPYTKRAAATPATPASFSFKLGAETLTVWYVKITLTGEPLKSSVQAAAAGGSSTATSNSGGGSTATSSSGGSSTPTTSSNDEHTHEINVKTTLDVGDMYIIYFDRGEGRFYIQSGSGSEYASTTEAHDNHTHTVTIPAHAHTVDIPAHAHTVDIPAHTHPLTYGLYTDTVYPSGLTVTINGAVFASGIELSAANNYTYEADITAVILAAGSLQQEHTIAVAVGEGQGEIQFQAQVLAVIQGISVG